jgi:hypothetical protein
MKVFVILEPFLYWEGGVFCIILILEFWNFLYCLGTKLKILCRERTLRIIYSANCMVKPYESWDSYCTDIVGSQYFNTSGFWPRYGPARCAYPSFKAH